MNNSARLVAFAGSLLSLSAVFLAALGAHLVDMNGMQATWQIASMIHLFQAAAIIGVAALLAKRESLLLQWGSWLLVAGTLVFCGSIYLHVVSGSKIPAVTPIGGVLIMSGWLLAALTFLRKS